MRICTRLSTRLWTRLWTKLWIFLLLFSVLGITSTQTHASEKKTIKVAYTMDHGFYMMEENGGLTGYEFDYLMMLAQFTDWEYEFILIEEENMAVAQQRAMDMVASGEADFMGNVLKNPETEAIFDFPTLNTGIRRYVLCSFATNYKVTQDNYFLQDTVKIALVEDAPINIMYRALVDLRGMNYEETYVSTGEEALQLLIDEKVDTIITADTSEHSWLLEKLTTVQRIPFYFVTRKGNQALLDELDEAITKLNILEPNLHQRLLSEYFGVLDTENIILTSDEEAALSGYDYLTVGLMKGREPYQFYEEGSEEIPQGISVEIFEEISSIIGVDFKYVWTDTREELRELIANEEVDIFATLPFDTNYEFANYFDVVVTQPYLTNSVVWLHQTEEVEHPVPHYYFFTENIPFFPNEELVEITNFQESLLELSSKGEISIFADPYMAQFFIQKLGLSNVEMQTVSSIPSEISIGVGKHLDVAVAGLLNNAILHLDSVVVDDIIYNNVTAKGSLTLEAFLRQHYGTILCFVIVLLTIVVIFLIQNSKNLHKITQQDSLTKLYNAGFFHKYVGERSGKISHGCLILVDIDLFKQINDTHGHQQGDHVIKAVAATLREHFRRDDIVARLGGDEFIIFLEYEPSMRNLEGRCTDILRILASDQNEVAATLSIGGYIFSKPTEYKELYQLADEVLYTVKERGRNGYAFSSDKES